VRSGACCAAFAAEGVGHCRSPASGAPRPAALVCATTAGLLARGSLAPALPSQAFAGLSGPPLARRTGQRLTANSCGGSRRLAPGPCGPAGTHGVPFYPVRTGPSTHKDISMSLTQSSWRVYGGSRPNRISMSAKTDTPLGAYLRDRRSRLDPAALGLFNARLGCAGRKWRSAPTSARPGILGWSRDAPARRRQTC